MGPRNAHNQEIFFSFLGRDQFVTSKKWRSPTVLFMRVSSYGPQTCLQTKNISSFGCLQSTLNTILRPEKSSRLIHARELLWAREMFTIKKYFFLLMSDINF